MSDFEPLPISSLAGLSDQELVDYVAAAHDSGDAEAERAALGYVGLAFEGLMASLIAMKVPKQDRYDVLVEAQISLMKASFQGKAIGELVNFVKTITRRRIADYTDAQAKKKDKTPVFVDGGEDGGIGKEIAVVGDDTDVHALLDAVEAVLEERSPEHQRVIRLYGPDAVPGFRGLSAAETKAEIEADGGSISVDNIAQIWSRFKKQLAGEVLDD